MVVLMFWKLLTAWLIRVYMLKATASHEYKLYLKHEVLYSVAQLGMKLFSLLVFMALVKIVVE